MPSDRKQTSVRTALCIIPPLEIWPQIQLLRRFHAQAYVRWMPHINMIYPFVPEEKLTQDVVAQIASRVANFDSFDMHLDGFQVLKHKKSATIFVRADEKANQSVVKLHQCIHPLFPECEIYDGQEELVPHLGIGRFPNADTFCRGYIRQWKQVFVPVSFTVDRLYVITRSGDTPFQVAHVIPLRGCSSSSSSSSSSLVTHITPKFKYKVGRPRSIDEAHHNQLFLTRKHKWVRLALQHFDAQHQIWTQHTLMHSNMPVDRKERGWFEAVSSEMPRTDGSPERLKFLSYNVLMNEYNVEIIHSEHRYLLLLELLKSHHAHVIGLQEVTAEFLDVLVDSPFIRENYYLSDVTGSTVDWYGQLFLFDKSSIKECRVEFFKHNSSKRALVAHLKTFRGTQLYVGCVHLTSDHSVQVDARALEVRSKQVQAVVDRIDELCASNVKNNVPHVRVVLGDFNFADGLPGYEDLFPEAYSDLWAQLHPDKRGFTWDPTNNFLARISSLDQQCKRLDRIFLAGRECQIESIKMVGNKPIDVTVDENTVVPLFPSDHYGLVCEVKIGREEQQLHDSKHGQQLTTQLSHREQVVQEYRNAVTNLTKTVVEDAEKRGACQFLTMTDGDWKDVPHMLNEEGRERRQAALHALTTAIEGLQNWDGPLKFVPIGSFRSGLDNAASDIDVCCLGTTHPKLFFQRMQESAFLNSSVQLVRKVTQAVLVPIVEFCVDGIALELSYCHIQEASTVRNFSVTDLKPSLRQGMERPSQYALDGVVDSFVLEKVLDRLSKPQRALFTQFHHVVVRWVKSNGMGSSRCGYFGGYAVTVLTLHVFRLYEDVATSVELLLEFFFSHFALLDWQNVPVHISLDVDLPVVRQADHAVAHIYTVSSRNIRNVVRNMTRSGLAVFREELHYAANLPTGSPVAMLWGGFEKVFARSYPFYIELSIYAATQGDFHAWSNFVSSRLISLIQMIERSEQLNRGGGEGKQVVGRLWPELFVTKGDHCEGTYFIGVGSCHRWEGKTSPENKASDVVAQKRLARMKSLVGDMMSSFETSFASFQAMRRPGMSISSCVRGELEMMGLADPDAMREKYGDDTKSSSVRREGKDMDVGQDRVEGEKKQSGDVESDAPISVTDPRVQPSDRLPTSEEICNRLAWDTKFRVHEYTVVYEDRFAGMQEQSVATFHAGKADTQNDAFVPWHRVWLFKHKGIVVWDRKNKLSTIFGFAEETNNRTTAHTKKQKKKKSPPSSARIRSKSPSGRSKSPSNRR